VRLGLGVGSFWPTPLSLHGQAIDNLEPPADRCHCSGSLAGSSAHHIPQPAQGILDSAVSR
jgi:hypothetical protein